MLYKKKKRKERNHTDDLIKKNPLPTFHLFPFFLKNKESIQDQEQDDMMENLSPLERLVKLSSSPTASERYTRTQLQKVKKKKLGDTSILKPRI
jgi:hypothetical protein